MKIIKPINTYLLGVKLLGICNFIIITVMIIEKTFDKSDLLFIGIFSIISVYYFLVHFFNFRYIKIEITDNKIVSYEPKHKYKIKDLLSWNTKRMRDFNVIEVPLNDLRYFGLYERSELLNYIKNNKGYFKEYHLGDIQIKKIKNSSNNIFTPYLFFMVFNDGTYKYITLERYNFTNQRNLQRAVQDTTGIEPYALRELTQIEKNKMEETDLHNVKAIIKLIFEFLLILSFLVIGMLGAYLLTQLEIYLKPSNLIFYENKSFLRVIYWCCSTITIAFIFAMFAAYKEKMKSFTNFYRKAIVYLAVITLISFLLSTFFNL